MAKGDVSQVVLVGGSTRIPKVQSMLSEVRASRPSLALASREGKGWVQRVIRAHARAVFQRQGVESRHQS